MTCPKCGADIPKGQDFCDYCGTRADAKMLVEERQYEVQNRQLDLEEKKIALEERKIALEQKQISSRPQKASRSNSAQDYGRELGAGIRESLQGLNTVCSPKSRKKAMRLIWIPLVAFWGSGIIGGLLVAAGIEVLSYPFIAIMAVSSFSLGAYQFYVGKIGKGILYTFTLGMFTIGALRDLFKLGVTKTFKDANDFPLLY